MNQEGLLHTDQILRDGGNITIASLVEQYSRDQKKFFNDFGAAMIKMGNIAVLTGSQGEIRKDCTRVNTP
ncbi:unnamed protein product [Cuscuta epithymum]|uniref:peroxidase n=1 Tax=Cuscuta epithymum TaxID=186058 RepID=A0AAV0CDS5_9ASTE|nr:unnamed protein product [Cuscuta epithymum]